MKNPEVLDIVALWLKENGFDGLMSYVCGCGCLKDDIVPCGEIESGCRAGYKAECTSECSGGCAGGHDWNGRYDPNDPTCWHIELENPEGKCGQK
jgi:hypothetical protein